MHVLKLRPSEGICETITRQCWKAIELFQQSIILPSQLSRLWQFFWNIQSIFNHNSWTQVRKKVLRLSQCRQWAKPIGTIALPSEVRCLFGIFLLFWSFWRLFVSFLYLAILSTLLVCYMAIECNRCNRNTCQSGLKVVQAWYCDIPWYIGFYQFPPLSCLNLLHVRATTHASVLACFSSNVI